MGSRMMHYAIAQQVAPLEWPFIYGSLAPDVSGPDREFKSQTHFMSTNEDGQTRSIHPEWFAKEYATKLRTNPFVRGYYAHLLEDDVWLQTVFARVIRPLTPTERPAKLATYYADFHTLNLMLAKEYQLPKPVIPTVDIETRPITEITGASVNGVVSDLVGDFEPVADRELALLTRDEITQYINDCVAVVRTKLSYIS